MNGTRLLPHKQQIALLIIQLMLKIIKFYSFCTGSKPTGISNDIEPVLWYYKSGKSTLSISQHVIMPDQAAKKLFPNFYISQDMYAEVEKLAPGFQQKSMQDIDFNGRALASIFRLLVRGNIGNKDLGLQINSLKANPYMKKLIQLKANNKVATKASQIIIDDVVEEKPGADISNILKANIMEVEKLIQVGLGLPISYMISKKNISNQNWMTSLARKRKAIHSDVIQTFTGTGSQKKPTVLEEVVYNHGFRLQHLFLRPYSRGCPTDLLTTNDSFNLEQVVKVLNIIDFEGKIILENGQNFAANVEFLDATLKKCGYIKRKVGDVDLIEQYMIF